MIKRILAAAMVLAALLSLVGCVQVTEPDQGRGKAYLLAVARRESGQEDATIEMVGQASEREKMLLWFMFTAADGERTYSAIEFEVLDTSAIDGNLYRFVHTYKPRERGEDIRVCEWDGGYSILINHPDCRYLELTYGDAKPQLVDIYQVPTAFSADPIPDEYRFLDEDQKELR